MIILRWTAFHSNIVFNFLGEKTAQVIFISQDRIKSNGFLFSTFQVFVAFPRKSYDTLHFPMMLKTKSKVSKWCRSLLNDTNNFANCILLISRGLLDLFVVGKISTSVSIVVSAIRTIKQSSFLSEYFVMAFVQYLLSYHLIRRRGKATVA